MVVQKIKATPGVISPTAETPALKIIGEVQSLHITSPADVIVLKVAFPVSREEVERVIAMWQSASGLPNPVVCLVKGVDVSVVRPGVKA